MISDNPRTITIFLASGNPNGIKKLEVSNRIVQAYVIPRIMLNEAKNYKDLTQPALYFLFDKEATRAYIGESENFYERVKNHDQSKDFWEVAVAFIAKDKSLEKGDIKYLESLAVENGKIANRLEMENKTIPPHNNLHEFKVPTIKEFFDDIALLTSTLGYPLFDKAITKNINPTDYWYCKSKTFNAKGIYNEKGFTVLAGSIVNPVNLPSYSPNFPKEAAERLEKINKYTRQISDTEAELMEDLTFPSVSRASGFCLGRATNGWIDWKNSEGKTMDEVLRKSNK
jgi:hypothetical protein